eukprot:2007680-Rhodomonas_salina.1
MARTGFLIRNLILLSLPCVAMSIASSSLNLAGGLVTLDPSNIPEHVDMSNYPSPTSSPSESPWGSNSDLRRLHQATTGAINPNMWRTGKEFKASRLRCVSVIPNCTFLLVLSGKSVQTTKRERVAETNRKASLQAGWIVVPQRWSAVGKCFSGRKGQFSLAPTSDIEQNVAYRLSVVLRLQASAQRTHALTTSRTRGVQQTDESPDAPPTYAPLVVRFDSTHPRHGDCRQGVGAEARWLSLCSNFQFLYPSSNHRTPPAAVGELVCGRCGPCAPHNRPQYQRSWPTPLARKSYLQCRERLCPTPLHTVSPRA